VSGQEREAAATVHLDALRWKADQAVWNHEGEHVWLKAGRPPCIEDCCLVDEPCKRHAGPEHRKGVDVMSDGQERDILAGDRKVLGNLCFWQGVARSAAEVADSEKMSLTETVARLRRLRGLGYVRHFPGESKHAGLWQATPAGFEVLR
jgi:hypothetical protein